LKPHPTILVVDDDPQMLRLVEKMLRPRQVTVLAAPKPSEALAICESQAVDLLISDVAMPEMDGHRLAKLVLERYPGASVLLISGHVKTPPPETPRMKFLPKPFYPSQLVQYLRELLPEE
jgi:CheY-like chemotaxis protein